MLNNGKFFIFGCPRSATTAFTKAINLADNAQIFIEQQPKMGYEAREKYLGHFQDAKPFVFSSKNEHILNVHHLNLHYGDKNQNYLAFIEDIVENWPEARVVFLYRDGRDVVRSLMNWHLNPNRRNNIFGMREDDPKSNIIYPVQDLWDYARIRPKPEEAIYEKWSYLDKFEKICWYWAKYNEVALEKLENVQEDKKLVINSTALNKEKIKTAFDFLELSGYDETTIQDFLEKRINNTQKPQNYFPPYEKWENYKKQVFHSYCDKMMVKLGLY